MNYDNNLHLTVDSIIDINNIIIYSNNMILRKLLLNHVDVIRYIRIKI